MKTKSPFALALAFLLSLTIAIPADISAEPQGGGQRAGEPSRGGIVNSMFAVLVDLSPLGGAELQGAVQSTLDHIRSARIAPDFAEILLPGEPERRVAATRRAQGIPVDDMSWAQIREAAASLGITEAELVSCAE